MRPIFCCLEDGTVFEGRSVTEACECGGLLSFYTGVVGYQEIITDPANLGKIIVYTYPLIGNYGASSADAESALPKAAGILAKEYPPYYSSFRAETSLKDYLASSSTVLGHCFDTRAMLLHLREHGEMGAIVGPDKLDAGEVKDMLAGLDVPEYKPENAPMACAAAKPAARAEVIDLGASKTFYRHLAEHGIDATCKPEKAEIVIVSDAPYYAVEDKAAVDLVAEHIGKRPVIGFGHGSAIAAKACGAKVERLPFGDHGVNIPVKFVGGGRNEITVQNHNYVVVPGSEVKGLFANLHDGTCEGFVCKSCGVAGANFLPPEAWLQAILSEVGVA